MDFAAEKRKWNGRDGERKENVPVEMSGLVKAPERDAGDENVRDLHRDFGGRRCDADERERGKITRRLRVADGRIKKCDRENGSEPDQPVERRQVVHGRPAGKFQLAKYFISLEGRSTNRARPDWTHCPAKSFTAKLLRSRLATASDWVAFG